MGLLERYGRPGDMLRAPSHVAALPQPSSAPGHRQKPRTPPSPIGQPSTLLYRPRAGVSGLSLGWGGGPHRRSLGNLGESGARLAEEEGWREGKGGLDPPRQQTLPVQVEDALLDAYDLVYDRAVRGPPGARRQELAAIHDTVSPVGRPPPPTPQCGRLWAPGLPAWTGIQERGSGWPPASGRARSGAATTNPGSRPRERPVHGDGGSRAADGRALGRPVRAGSQPGGQPCRRGPPGGCGWR